MNVLSLEFSLVVHVFDTIPERLMTCAKQRIRTDVFPGYCGRPRAGLVLSAEARKVEQRPAQHGTGEQQRPVTRAARVIIKLEVKMHFPIHHCLLLSQDGAAFECGEKGDLLGKPSGIHLHNIVSALAPILVRAERRLFHAYSAYSLA